MPAQEAMESLLAWRWYFMKRAKYWIILQNLSLPSTRASVNFARLTCLVEECDCLVKVHTLYV